MELAVVWVLTWGLIPYILSQRTKTPVAVLAWMWAVLLIPVVGAVAFMLFGSERIQRKRLKMRKQFRDAVKLGADEGVETSTGVNLARDFPELFRINGVRATMGNSARLLADGATFFPRLLEIINEAKHHLHLQFYIWANDETGRKVRAALIAACERGVKVRVLLDEIGSFSTFRRFFKDVENAGGSFAWFGTFAPFKGSLHMNLRNHGKLVIADGTVAITGGMNVADEYWMGVGKELPYRDLQVELDGPSVTQLAEIFAQDWYFATKEKLTGSEYYPEQACCGEVALQVVAGGPDNDLNEIQLSVLTLLNRAKQKIWLMTPYLVPEPALLSALQIAAMRGVDVRIIVPLKGDHFYLTAVTRSYYEQLLPYGIKVYEYRPRMLHAKVSTIDGLYAMAGSANMDIRSLRLNFELNVLMAEPSLIDEVEAMFTHDFAVSERVKWQKHQVRPFSQKILEAVCRPLAPLL